MLSDDAVRVYRASNPDTPIIYRRGNLAESAVPNWSMPVDDLLDKEVWKKFSAPTD